MCEWGSAGRCVKSNFKIYKDLLLRYKDLILILINIIYVKKTKANHVKDWKCSYETENCVQECERTAIKKVITLIQGALNLVMSYDRICLQKSSKLSILDLVWQI